jgi:hypothetical protein
MNCYMKQYIENNPDYKERKKQSYRDWRKANEDYAIQLCAEWREANREKSRQTAKAWGKENPGKKNAQNAKRKAQKLKATPTWADLKKIEEIYINRPDGYHVDHIIPLQGKNVCGLHVEYNLQYLPAKENISKGNKLK